MPDAEWREGGSEGERVCKGGGEGAGYLVGRRGEGAGGGKRRFGANLFGAKENAKLTSLLK